MSIRHSTPRLTPPVRNRYVRALTSTNTSPPEPTRFDDLPLSDEARAGLESLGYEMATPVQAAAYQPAMDGRDLVVQAKTGTGKTAAFGLPLIERIRRDQARIDPQSLILCPTRELAVQVAEEIAELGDPGGIQVLPIYGGTPMQPQLAGLKAGCDVVVGTPGRVLDHIRRRTLRLVHVHIAILDEADEMLSMGFWDEVTAILERRGGLRRGQSSSIPPLAGVFDEETASDDDADDANADADAPDAEHEDDGGEDKGDGADQQPSKDEADA